MARGTEKNKNARPLGHVIKELETKVVEAAQNLQRQLAGGAEQPALAGSSIERADAHNDFPAGEDPPLLNKLKERQRKRGAEAEAEEQRPFAKPKAAKRQNKRTAAELFGARARDCSEIEDRDLEEPGAASSSCAAQSEQQLKNRITRVFNDLKRLLQSAMIDDEAQNKCERLKDAACLLQTHRFHYHIWLIDFIHPTIL